MAESPLVSNEGKARPGLFRAGFVGLENGFVAGWPMPAQSWSRDRTPFWQRDTPRDWLLIGSDRRLHIR
jgi:hypothetical protein